MTKSGLTKTKLQTLPNIGDGGKGGSVNNRFASNYDSNHKHTPEYVTCVDLWVTSKKNVVVSPETHNNKYFVKFNPTVIIAKVDRH